MKKSFGAMPQIVSMFMCLSKLFVEILLNTNKTIRQIKNPATKCYGVMYPTHLPTHKVSQSEEITDTKLHLPS